MSNSSYYGSMLRCPDCGHLFSAEDYNDATIFTSGLHDALCPKCGGDFEIETAISYSWVSPPKKGKP